MTRSLASKWVQFASNKLLVSFILWDKFPGTTPWLNGRSNGTDMYYGTLLAALVAPPISLLFTL